MSPIAAPESKIQSIITELNEMASSGERNEFQIKRFKLEADKLRDKQPDVAFTILGMIACLEKNIDDVHRFHKNAIAYATEKVMVTMQYVISLLNLCMYEAAHSVLKELYKEYDEEIIVLDALIKNSAILNLIDDYRIYCDIYKKTTGKDHDSLPLSESFEDPQHDSETIDMFDALMEKHPEMVVSPEQDLVKLADDLVDGVEV